MRKATLITVLVYLFMAGIPGFTGLGHASCCPDEHYYCYAEEGQGDLEGKVSVGTCYNWKRMGCFLCRGQGEPARHCNGKYSQCEGNCFACESKRR